MPLLLLLDDLIHISIGKIVFLRCEHNAFCVPTESVVSCTFESRWTFLFIFIIHGVCVYLFMYVWMQWHIQGRENFRANPQHPFIGKTKLILIFFERSDRSISFYKKKKKKKRFRSIMLDNQIHRTNCVSHSR